MSHKATQPKVVPLHVRDLQAAFESKRYARVAGVGKRYDVSDATVWRWSANPEMGFPKPISLSPGVVVLLVFPFQFFKEQ